MQLHAHVPNVQSKEDLQRTSQMGTPYAQRVSKRSTVSFSNTQCVHVHKSVRVTVRACSHILL